MTKPEPTTEDLQAAYQRLRAARPGAWPNTFTETMTHHPLKARIVRASALQAMPAPPRHQVRVPYQRPDGQWRSAVVVGTTTQQLEIDAK